MLDPVIAPYLISGMVICLWLWLLSIIAAPAVIKMFKSIDEWIQIGGEEGHNPPTDIEQGGDQ